MRSTRCWFVAVVCAAVLGAGIAPAADDPLVSAAAEENQFLLAEFTSTSCPACDEMRPVVERVRSSYPSLIYQQIDADLEPELSKRYNVKCVPVYVVVDPDGTVRFNDVGMRTAEELAEILNAAGVRPR